MAAHRAAAAAAVAVIVLLATSPAAASSVEACPGATGTMKSAVTLSPLCLAACPELCGIVADMLIQYRAASMSEKEAVAVELQGQVCQQKEKFKCLFGENKEKCDRILEVGRAFIPSVPESRTGLDEVCSKRPTSLKHRLTQDVQIAMGNETEGDDADASQTTTKENSDSAHTTQVLGPVLVAVVALLARV